MPNIIAEHKTIGVVTDRFIQPQTIGLLNALSSQLNQHNCSLLLLNPASCEEYRAMLRRVVNDIDGLIFLASDVDENFVFAQSIRPALSATRIGSGDTSNTGNICINGYDAGQQVAQLFVGQRFSRPGYIQARSGSLSPQMAGYAAFLESARRPVKQWLTAGGYQRTDAYGAMMHYLKITWASERVDALFCESDELAFGAMQAVRDFGEGVHIGIVGVGDSDEAKSPTWHLTSFSLRYDLLAHEALNRLSGKSSDLCEDWRCGKLNVRRSHLSRAQMTEPVQCGCASRH